MSQALIPIVLAVDVGNTNLKWGVFREEQLLFTQRWQVKSENDSALSQQWQELLAQLQAKNSPLKALVYGSGKKAIHHWLNRVVKPNLPAIDWLYIEPGHQQPYVDCTLYAPNQLGADRMANLVAAAGANPGQSCIVLDFGTATTIDALNAKGRFQGGALLAGFQAYQSALPQAVPTLGLLLDEALPKTLSGFGFSTQDCFKVGLELGYVGAVHQIIQTQSEKMQALTGEKPFIIATGGGASTFQQLEQAFGQSVIDEIKPNLTLEGLFQLYKAAKA